MSKRKFCNEVFGNHSCLSWLKNDRCPSSDGVLCCSKFMQPLQPEISSLDKKDEIDDEYPIGVVTFSGTTEDVKKCNRAYF